jgi:hypothetical protein
MGPFWGQAQITALRGCLTPTIAVLRGMTRNLAWLEASCVTELREDFELCRSMANADPELAPLEAVDDYLYGPAAKAAETRRDNRRTFEDMTLKAEKEGMAAASRKARTTITQELEGLIQDIRRTEPHSEENRKDPR